MLPLEPYDRNGLAGGPTQNNHFQTEQTNRIKNKTNKEKNKNKTIFNKQSKRRIKSVPFIYQNIL